MTAQLHSRMQSSETYSLADAATLHRMAQARRAEMIADAILTAYVGLKKLARSVGRGLAGWQRREQAYQQLMSLDDRMLKDIGLCRGDVPLVLTGDLPHPRRGMAANENQGQPANQNRPRTAA